MWCVSLISPRLTRSFASGSWTTSRDAVSSSTISETTENRPPPRPYRYRYTENMADEEYSRHLIRIARRQARMTQTELAKRAKTSQAAVSAYESGRRSPSVDTLCRILDAAGFEVRMRLSTPDTHDSSRRSAERLLPAAQRQTFASREAARVRRAQRTRA